jgi:hypothetical protein
MAIGIKGLLVTSIGVDWSGHEPEQAERDPNKCRENARKVKQKRSNGSKKRTIQMSVASQALDIQIEQVYS